MMRVLRKLGIAVALQLCAWGLAVGQDLAPRAYVITPLHSNVVDLEYSYFDGNVLFNGAAPISGATAKINLFVISYYHSLNFFGRSANVSVSLPYGEGNYHGTVNT